MFAVIINLTPEDFSVIAPPVNFSTTPPNKRILSLDVISGSPTAVGITNMLARDNPRLTKTATIIYSSVNIRECNLCKGLSLSKVIVLCFKHGYHNKLNTKLLL
jgi:hypothetical protein